MSQYLESNKIEIIEGVKHKASKFKGLNSFLNGIERDWDAVKNSLCYSYSNGLIESKVNKTKLLKRNMYGRCSFKTLRNKAIIYDSIFQ